MQKIDSTSSLSESILELEVRRAEEGKMLKEQVNQTNSVTFASWQVQYFGCTNNNPSALTTADPDGDGQNNYSEFLSRTDPTTNASVFRLVSGAAGPSPFVWNVTALPNGAQYRVRIVVNDNGAPALSASDASASNASD